MEDLLKMQIHENCRLALPEGVKDLMADISREVLRHQPSNIYQFIADYLAALLVTRENLTIAAHVCSDTCNVACNPELKDELLDLGLDDEDCDEATNIIQKAFESGNVSENSLLQTLQRKLNNIELTQLSKIKEVIHRAFARNQINNTVIYEFSSSDDETDEVTRAARHTMNLYRRMSPSVNERNIMAKKIQVAYRAYCVKREKCIYGPKPCERQELTPSESNERLSKTIKLTGPKSTKFDSNCSFVHLPTHTPYSNFVHDKDLQACSEHEIQREIKSEINAHSEILKEKRKSKEQHNFQQKIHLNSLDEDEVEVHNVSFTIDAAEHVIDDKEYKIHEEFDDAEEVCEIVEEETSENEEVDEQIFIEDYVDEINDENDINDNRGEIFDEDNGDDGDGD